MSYDPRCYELAKFFLADVEIDEAEKERAADRLATRIQVTIEEFCGDL